MLGLAPTIEGWQEGLKMSSKVLDLYNASLPYLAKAWAWLEQAAAQVFVWAKTYTHATMFIIGFFLGLIASRFI